jgi:hypothetical protein
MKHVLASLLACYIAVAACGYPSPGAATDDFNSQPDWTLLHPHNIGTSGDGTFFLEFVLRGQQRGDLCYAIWNSVQPQCPDLDTTVSDGLVLRKTK